MKTHIIRFSIALALLGYGIVRGADAVKTEQSRVSVVFVKPAEFTDLKSSELGSDKERSELLDEFQKYFRETGERLLSAGQRLELTITNIDMAGDFEPWRGAQFQDVRFVRDIYPPRIDLEFRLLDASGKVLKEGKRELRDMAFMMKLSILPDSDRLRREKDLIYDWFSQEFSGISKKA